MIAKAYQQSLAANFHQTGLVFNQFVLMRLRVLDRNTVCVCVGVCESFCESPKLVYLVTTHL